MKRTFAVAALALYHAANAVLLNPAQEEQLPLSADLGLAQTMTEEPFSFAQTFASAEDLYEVRGDGELWVSKNKGSTWKKDTTSKDMVTDDNGVMFKQNESTKKWSKSEKVSKKPEPAVKKAAPKKAAIKKSASESAVEVRAAPEKKAGGISNRG